MQNKMNPLLQEFNTAPFSKISAEDYKPAIKTEIENTKKEIAKMPGWPKLAQKIPKIVKKLPGNILLSRNNVTKC